MVWGYLQWVTKRYRQICKKMCINIVFKNMIVTRANALQIAQNQANLQENMQ